MDPKYRELCKRYYQYYNHGQIKNENEIDICDQHLEKMLKKVYPGRQVECSYSSQPEIDHKIKGVNDYNGETQEEENITQDDRKSIKSNTGMWL